MRLSNVLFLSLSCIWPITCAKDAATKPNIVVIMSDDQDLVLGSTDYQSVLHAEIFDKGVQFVNHYATTAQCCPSRASFLRGQHSHNTNITHVNAPGGNYDKWVIAGEDTNYLPHWLKKAGYRTEYIGKLLNGYNVKNYNITPKGWDHADCLIDPYTYSFNNVVMSKNGETPISYHGYHQTDVIRAKALDRLDYLTAEDGPFYIQIAPSSPHVNEDLGLTVPLKRHVGQFPNAMAPRIPSYNPPDDIQDNKRNWMRGLPLMNETRINATDFSYQARVEALQGVDEIIQDVIALLEKKGVIDNTYIVYTTDNGYHLGNFRLPAGKALPYRQDTNLPFAVRGPGIPEGRTSLIPSAHIDLAPTFLEIAQLPVEDYPEFFGGKSVLQQWKSPGDTSLAPDEGVGRELVNIEFWGLCIIEELPISVFPNNTYKTLRVVGNEFSWLFIKWCNNDMELYNTKNDPYELYNVADSQDPDIVRLLTRLNAILLVTKSCTEDSCRDPWMYLQPDSSTSIASLKEAMDSTYDAFYASLPQIHFDACLNYQKPSIEAPFWPPSAASDLGMAYRNSTDNFKSTDSGNATVAPNGQLQGGWEQRNVTIEEIMKSARNLTAAELTGVTNDDTVSAEVRRWLKWT